MFCPRLAANEDKKICLSLCAVMYPSVAESVYTKIFSQNNFHTDMNENTRCYKRSVELKIVILTIIITTPNLKNFFFFKADKYFSQKQKPVQAELNSFNT